MGTFAGHVIPGVFMFVLGFHWIIGVFNQYFQSLVRRRKPGGQLGFKTRCSYPFPFCPKYPLEGMLKMALAGSGLAGEVATGIKKQGQYFEMENSQHVVMYFFFIISGLSDVLKSSGHYIPPNTDYSALLMATVVTGMLFRSHTDGHSMLNAHIHNLVFCIFALMAICVALEMRYPRNPLSPIFRALFSLFCGTWFIEISFILYNPLPNGREWDPNSHREIMLVTVIFAAHFLGNLLLVILIGLLVFLRYRKELKNNDETFGYSKLNGHETSVNMKNLNPLAKKSCVRCDDHRDDDDSEA